MAQYSKRGRNRNNRRQGGNNNPNRSLDSQGPEVKIRGTAAQIYDKYQALARDAASSGDRIRAESLMQHAEHYYRLMKSMQPDKPAEPKKDETADAPNAEAASADAAVTEAKSADGESKPEAAEASADAPAEEQAAASDEAQEEAKPRRRRRRRRNDEQTAEAAGDGEPAPAPEKLEEVAAE